MIFIDQMHRQVNVLPQPPTRIVSLVPSQTELLFHLGVGDKVVGVTKFCIHPAEQVKQKAMIGGTKHFKFDVIDHLQPDLIIGNKEENYQEGIEQLQQKYPVWMSDIYTLDDALQMMLSIGFLTGTENKAQSLVETIQHQFSQLKPAVPPTRVAYFIWRKPYMSIGNHNFIDDIMSRCGFENVFGHLSRYPEITPDQLKAANPQVIFLSSEPYPFKEKHIVEFQTICPEAQIKVVDGELFSWYGSRLLHSGAYLKHLLLDLGA